jgi:uncharacterized protein
VLICVIRGQNTFRVNLCNSRIKSNFCIFAYKRAYKEKRMIIANEKVAEKVIRDSVNELLPNSSILLFGSRARHDNTAESDFDLMIITRDIHENKQLRLYKAIIRKKLAQNNIPADIIIQSEAEVNIKKEITGHIVRQILKEGIPL